MSHEQDVEDLKAAVNSWNAALDHGDIEALVATADPEIIICNERTPTAVGLKALREKYAPRIAAFDFESKTEIHEIQVFGDFAVLVLAFDVTATNKTTGEKGGGSGRLVLGYRRDADRAWKVVLDVDNNA